MNRRLMMTMVVAASMLGSEAMYAAPLAFHVPVHAMLTNEKPVSFSLRNDTKQPVTIKAGDTEMTVQPGKTVAMKLRSGEKIVTETALSNSPVGTVLAVVSPDLSNATVILN